MTSIQIQVNGAAASVTQQGKLTAGMVGVPVTIEYDSAWNDLEKTVVFKSGLTCRNRFQVEGETTVPHEVLKKPGMHLTVGIEGRNADGTLVIRTVTAAAGKIFPSLDPSEDPSADPALTIWARLLGMIGDLDNLINEDKSSLVAAVNELAAKSLTVEPRDDDIPKVFFGSALPQTKDDTVMSFRYISKTMDINGYCKTKAQGSSSMSYPKKNQTVKLYKDAECSQKLKVDFKGWGKQSKFCFKANWIDLTHARNIVSARLWGDVVRSRDDYAELPEELRTSPNQGAIDGFPVKVYAGGVYQGRYTINIPKDAWMANMDDELDSHCILCGESNADDRSLFRAEAAIDGSDWTDEVHDSAPDAIRDRWNEAIRFIVNSTDEDFVAGIGGYFDVQSLIDYYLFGLASCGLDAFGKNQLYMTYDGQKWFATMYDMDSTWGLWWDGSYFVSETYSRTDYQDFADGEGNLLYIRLEALFADAVKARWEALRRGPLSAENILERFERFTDIAPPWLVAEDFADTTANGAFKAIPLQSLNNIQQIREYARARMEYVADYLVNGEAEKDVIEVDYTLDPLADVTWHDDASYWPDNGDFYTETSEHCTDKFSLQDCLYHFDYGNGEYPALFIWDEEGNYVGRIATNISYFAAKSGYQYAVKVNQASGFDAALISLMPVDNRETMCGAITIDPAEIAFETYFDAGIRANITALIPLDSVTLLALTEKINHANSIILLGDALPASNNVTSELVWSVYQLNNDTVYLHLHRFGADVAAAKEYFAAHNTTLVING